LLVSPKEYVHNILPGSNRQEPLIEDVFATIFLPGKASFSRLVLFVPTVPFDRGLAEAGYCTTKLYARFGRSGAYEEIAQQRIYFKESDLTNLNHNTPDTSANVNIYQDVKAPLKNLMDEADATKANNDQERSTA
jgi:hypothetical protein